MSSNLVEVGALWKGKDKNGKGMLTGKLGSRARMLVFANKKDKESQPDYLVYVTPDRGEDGSGVRTWSADSGPSS